MRLTTAGRTLLAACCALAAGCAPSPSPAPAPSAAAEAAGSTQAETIESTEAGDAGADLSVPVELYADDEVRIGYIPASLEWLPDGAWQALALREHLTPQALGDVRFTTHQMRIRLRCGETTTISVWADSMYLDGTVVAGHTYRSTVWGIVGRHRSEEWPLAICARADSALADPAGDPGGRLAAAPGLAEAKRAYVRAWLAPDPARVGESFTDDVSVRLGDQSFSGRAGTMEGWIAADHGRVRALRLVTGTVEVDGATATEHGRLWARYQGRDGVESEEAGAFVHSWTRGADGRWRLRAVTLTPDAPGEG